LIEKSVFEAKKVFLKLKSHDSQACFYFHTALYPVESVLAADLFLGGMIAPLISYFKVELFCGRISVIIELAVLSCSSGNGGYVFIGFMKLVLEFRSPR
jgi:hypothetical protein